MNLHCGVCGSARLTPPGEIQVPGSTAITFTLKPRVGMFKSRPKLEVTKARACRDCGTIFPVVSRTLLARHLDEGTTEDYGD
ncbi:hypothetical protein AB5J62_34335 [Amycolatopsis sp. cg5]|uniref:hypothetical protein n=1 Tax=Amycolatopsis sp. cg5 TaxID=3238802 RepID=UPI0035265076